jgi:hypothetical protein
MWQEGFRVLEEADIQEVPDCHATKLTEEDLDQLTTFTKPKDEEHSDVVLRGLSWQSVRWGNTFRWQMT